MILIEITEKGLDYAMDQANTDMICGRLGKGETYKDRVKTYLRERSRVYAKYPDNTSAEFTIDGLDTK